MRKQIIKINDSMNDGVPKSIRTMEQIAVTQQNIRGEILKREKPARINRKGRTASQPAF